MPQRLAPEPARAIGSASRQRQRFKIQRAALAPTHDHGVLRVQAIKLFDARPAFNSLVGQSLLLGDRRGNALRVLDVIGVNLHDAAAAVGEQEIVLALLLIDDHVEGPVAVAEFGDGLAFDLRAGL